MSVITEPEIQRIGVAQNTNATLNTLTTNTVLAAPGAGTRYRIYSASIGIDLATATPAATSGMTGVMTNVGVFSIEWPAHPAFALPLPSAGIPIPTNVALTINTWAATSIVGGLGYRLVVGYVIETV